MRGFIASGVLAGFIMTLVACSSTDIKESLIDEPQFLTFVDASVFDVQVSDAMAARAPIISVRFPETVTTNNIPERVAKWLYVLVDRYDGSSEVLPDPALPVPKGVSDELSKLVMKAYTSLEQYILYRPSEHYNAIIYVVPRKSQITHVDFVRKDKD